jgi:hypothetical protein
LKKKALITTAFISILLFSAVAGIAFVNMAKADPMFFLSNILIKSDGSIVPETEVITRTGNVYSLTVDIIYQYAIKIQCSNIVLDGAGHIINGTFPSIKRGRWFSDRNGLSIEDVTNVTVRNIEITGFSDFDVSLKNSRACYFLKMKADDGVVLENSSSNLITECNLAAFTEAVQPGIYLTSSNNNKFYRNNITDLLLRTSNNNIFFENNFVIDNFLSMGGNNLWDNGTVGNYWSDYAARYPNASEMGNSGIGDTPYVIDADNVDYYPLMRPYDIENDTIAFPTPEPTSTPEPEPFPTALVIAVSGVAVAIIGVGLLVYFRKRGRGHNK